MSQITDEEIKALERRIAAGRTTSKDVHLHREIIAQITREVKYARR